MKKCTLPVEKSEHSERNLDKCMDIIKFLEDRKKVYKEAILGTVETV